MKQSYLLILSTACIQIVHSLRCCFADGASHRYDTLVYLKLGFISHFTFSRASVSSEAYLDAGNDAVLLHHIHETRAVVRLLIERLVEHDHTGDMLIHIGSGEEQLKMGYCIDQ